MPRPRMLNERNEADFAATPPMPLFLSFTPLSFAIRLLRRVAERREPGAIISWR